MPRNASGNCTLPAGNPVQFGTLIDPVWANTTEADQAAMLTDSLSRSGKGGMLAVLNMGGFKVASAAGATASTDLPTALQVRSGTFSYLFPVSSDALGNAYTGTSPLPEAPVAGTVFSFIADKTNTGAMTLSVNGGAVLPITFNNTAAIAGTVQAGAAVQVIYFNNEYRATAGGVTNGISSVTSSVPAVLTGSVAAGVLALAPHVNVANGMLQIDNSGKVPPSFWPTTPMQFMGPWNASGGTLPPNGTVHGQYYLLTPGGTVTVYRAVGTQTFTPLSTIAPPGAVIVWNTNSTVDQPLGWYYIAPVAGTAASVITITPTAPLFGAAVDVQGWMNLADPYINGLLPKAGGTMTGDILQPLAPAVGNSLANRTYVDNKAAAVNTGVLSFQGRTAAAAVLLSADVTGALGYTPANIGGDSFTGPIDAPVIGSAAFIPLAKVANIAGVQNIDFLEAQSQILTLTATASIAAVNNFPVGSLLRLTLKATNLVITSWPAAVKWPGTGSVPDLTTGAQKTAIVVIENDGTNYLAAASVY